MRACTIRATALLAITALAACSGSGTPSSPIPARAPVATSSAPASTSSKTRATVVIHWPSAAQQASASKRRDTISPSTQSISVTVNGGSPTVVNKPTLTGSPSSTSISIVAPPGNDGFTFTAWDELDAAGNILDQSTVNQNIVADANNTVAVVLDGVCAALVPTLYASSIYAETRSITTPVNAGSRTVLKTARLVGNSTQSFAFTPVDADGNTILTGAGTGSISVTESGPTPHVTIAANAAGAANTVFKVTPTVAEPDGFSTQLTASSPNCGQGTTTLPNSFALSTSAAIYVADEYTGVNAFDQDGTQLARLSGTTSVYGLAYNSKSNYLVTIEPNYSSQGLFAFQTLSPTGSSLGSGYITPSGYSSSGEPASIPYGAVYNPSNGYIAIEVTPEDVGGNEVPGNVVLYAISGSTATLEKSNFGSAALQDPQAITVLPNGYYVVSDGATGSTYLFDQTGDVFPNPVNETAVTLTVDTLRGNVLTQDVDVDPNSGADSYPGGVISYPDNSLEHTQEFYLPPLNFAGGGYSALVYNQGNDELYLFGGNATNIAMPGSAVYAGGFTASTLPAGAFSSITAPTQAVLVP